MTCVITISSDSDDTTARVLYEHLAHDDDGHPLATMCMEHRLPAATEISLIDYGHAEASR
jgi:hypothetical protein